jgi:hypothetical protein
MLQDFSVFGGEDSRGVSGIAYWKKEKLASKPQQ